METDRKLWFKAKRYGWGWTPATWQGWLILLLYIIGIFSEMNGSKSSADLVSITVLTIFLIVICYAKGEKPRWQWGEKTNVDKTSSETQQ